MFNAHIPLYYDYYNTKQLASPVHCALTLATCIRFLIYVLSWRYIYVFLVHSLIAIYVPYMVKRVIFISQTLYKDLHMRIGELKG